MTPDPVMEDRFLEVMAALVQERMKADGQRAREQTARERAERRQRLVGKVPSIRAIVDEMRAKGECDFTYEQLMGLPQAKDKSDTTEVKPAPVAEAEAPKDTVAACELDSFVLAKALSYMGVLEGHLLNMSQIQAILYISYGLWLATRGERLTKEHPQMWQFGPVFPRAYGRFRKDPGDGKAEYEQLKAACPEVLEFLSERFHRHAWTRAGVLTAPHTAAGSPWAKTRKGSPDKWGAVIEDSVIREWFAAKISR